MRPTVCADPWNSEKHRSRTRYYKSWCYQFCKWLYLQTYTWVARRINPRYFRVDCSIASPSSYISTLIYTHLYRYSIYVIWRQWQPRGNSRLISVKVIAALAMSSIPAPFGTFLYKWLGLRSHFCVCLVRLPCHSHAPHIFFILYFFLVCVDILGMYKDMAV